MLRKMKKNRNKKMKADLTKSQIKKVHKMADELPKKDFIKRYGKDGDLLDMQQQLIS